MKLKEYHTHYQKYSEKLSESCRFIFLFDAMVLPGYAVMPLMVFAMLEVLQYFIGMCGYSILADKIVKDKNADIRSDKLRFVLCSIMDIKLGVIVGLNAAEIVLHLKL